MSHRSVAKHKGYTICAFSPVQARELNDTFLPNVQFISWGPPSVPTRIRFHFWDRKGSALSRQGGLILLLESAVCLEGSNVSIAKQTWRRNTGKNRNKRSERKRGGRERGYRRRGRHRCMLEATASAVRSASRGQLITER